VPVLVKTSYGFGDDSRILKEIEEIEAETAGR
jgi:hypothetical protein